MRHPMRRVLTDYTGVNGYDVVTSRYNGGYLDFVLWEHQTASGPPQTSLRDGFLFYLQNHSDLLDLNDPAALGMFLEKTLASHFLKLLEFLQTNIETVQMALSRRQDFSAFGLTIVEKM